MVGCQSLLIWTSTGVGLDMNLKSCLKTSRIQLKKDGQASINGWKMYLDDSPGTPIKPSGSDTPNVTGISKEKLVMTLKT